MNSESLIREIPAQNVLILNKKKILKLKIHETMIRDVESKFEKHMNKFLFPINFIQQNLSLILNWEFEITIIQQ